MFNILEQLVYLLTNVINMVFVIIFAHSVYNEKYPIKTITLASLIYGLIITGFMYLAGTVHLSSSWSFIIAIPPAVFFLKKFFNLNYLKGITAVGIFYILGAIANITAVLIFNFCGIKNIFRDFDLKILLLGNLIIYTIISLVLVIIRRFKVFLILPHEIKRKAYLSNVINLIFSLFIIAANMSYYYNSPDNGYKNTGLILTAILILGYFVYSILSANFLWKLELKKHELENQIFYNQTLEILMRDLVRFKHDYNNHLNVMNCYIQLKKWGELTAYFKELVDETNTTTKFNQMNIINVKNAGILGLLTSKIEYSQKSGVKMLLEIQDEIKEINMKISELCEVLGNFLDNAIEAASASKEQFVRVRISNTNKIITFIIENSVAWEVDPKKIFEWGYSTKEGSQGAGLWIVQKIINKYKNVSLNTIAGEQNLIQELTIIQTQNPEILKNSAKPKSIRKKITFPPEG